MATVAELIKQLQDEDQEATVIFQYLLPEHLGMDNETFAEIDEYLGGTSFFDSISNEMISWIEDVQSELEEDEEEDE